MSTYRHQLRAKERLHQKIDKGYTFYVHSRYGNRPDVSEIRAALEELEGHEASMRATSDWQFEILKSERVD